MKRTARRVVSSVAFRLAAAFVVVLALFAATLAVALRTFDQLAAAESEVSSLDEAKHAGHVVAGLVREEYIHQAHTIIEWNRSHLEHYEIAAHQARGATKRLLEMPLTPAERQQARQVSALAARIDEEFHRQILPAVDAGDRERVHELHAHTESQVNRVVAINEELNLSLERRSATARSKEGSLRRRAGVIVIGCFLLAIVVTTCAWLAVALGIVRRLSLLREGALRLSGGDLRSRVSLRGTDELSELGTTFNEMATALESHQRRLIESSRLALLGQVAAGVAHEINNPLSVILGYASVFRKKEAGHSELSEPLRIIEGEARQCQRIVEALLDLGRPIASSTSLVNLVDVAREVIERLLESGSAGSRTIHGPAAGTIAIVRGDAAAIRQIVSNILLNAIDATRESGTITLRVHRGADFVELEVEDDGTGIAPDVLPRVLEPFFTTKATGTGLGLAICLAIASAHGGSLALRSEVGSGTSVRLRLPAAEGRQEAAQ